MMDNEREQYDADQLLTFQNGSQANMTLKKSWEFWVAIGKALMIGSKMCALRTCASWPNPKGSAYNAEFGKWLTKGGGHEASAWVKDYAAGKKNESLRTRLMECMRHLPEIDAWRATLDDHDRNLRLNNPTNVLAAWRKYVKDREIAEGKRKAPVKKPGLKEEVAKLQRETDDYRAALKARILGPGLSVEKMAKAVLENNPGLTGISQDKFEDFVRVLRGMRKNASASAKIREGNKDDDEDDAPDKPVKLSDALAEVAEDIAGGFRKLGHSVTVKTSKPKGKPKVRKFRAGSANANRAISAISGK